MGICLIDWVDKLEIYDPRLWGGLEHESGAGRTAAVPGGGDGRLRWEMGVGAEGGAAGRVENRFGLRLGGSDY